MLFAGLSFTTVLVVFAVVLAVNCNPDNKLLMGIVAALAPHIYLIQFSIRKFILKETGYCPLPAPPSSS
jgi:hypothetical protein